VKRRRVAIAGTALLLGLGGTAPAHAATGAVGAVTTGSWWQGQQAGGAVPPPPTVPTKGLWVESEASGPTAISALRFTLTGATAPVVTLTVHQAQPASQVEIQVCPTTSDWKPVSAGVWADRPAADCSQVQAAGVLSGDATTMKIDLSAFPVGADGTVDAVLQPAPTATNLPVSPPALGQPSAAPTFDATFEPPEPSQIATTPAAPSFGTSDTTLPPQSAPDITPAPAFSAPLQAPLPATASTPAVTFEPPVTQPPATAPTPPPPQVQLASPAPRLATSKPGGMTRRERILVMLLLLDGAFLLMHQGYLSPGARPRRLTIYDDPRHLPEPAPVESRAGQAPALR